MLKKERCRGEEDGGGRRGGRWRSRVMYHAGRGQARAGYVISYRGAW